jgi:hypothetical protein
MSIYTRDWYWENFAEREQLVRGCRPRLSRDDRTRVETMLAQVREFAVAATLSGSLPDIPLAMHSGTVCGEIPVNRRELHECLDSRGIHGCNLACLGAA